MEGVFIFPKEKKKNLGLFFGILFALLQSQQQQQLDW